MVKNYIRSDDKNLNLSLMAGLLVVTVIALFEIVEEIFERASWDPLILKIFILIVFGFWLICQWKHWDKNQRNR